MRDVRLRLQDQFPESAQRILPLRQNPLHQWSAHPGHHQRIPFTHTDLFESVTEPCFYVRFQTAAADVLLCSGQRTFADIRGNSGRYFFLLYQVYRQISMITPHIYQPVPFGHHIRNSRKP